MQRKEQEKLEIGYLEKLVRGEPRPLSSHPLGRILFLCVPFS